MARKKSSGFFETLIKSIFSSGTTVHRGHNWLGQKVTRVVNHETGTTQQHTRGQGFFGDVTTRETTDKHGKTINRKRTKPGILWGTTTTHSGVCRCCKGAGSKVLSCHPCAGSGTFSGTCGGCSGTGRYQPASGPCHACRATGYRSGSACRRCSGTGQYAAQPRECNRCSGAGTFSGSCRRCEGSGSFSVQCNACSGSGSFHRES